jgi:type IV pilus assembly protein PilV
MLITRHIERFLRPVMRERVARIKRGQSARRKGEAGFTLVELLVALTILSIGLLGLAGLATNAMKASNNALSITQASNIAQDRLELLLGVNISNLNATDLITTNLELRRTCVQIDTALARPKWSCTPASSVWLDNNEYTWNYSVTHVDLDGNGAAVLSHDALLRIDLNVYWTDILWGVQKSLSTTALRSSE